MNQLQVIDIDTVNAHKDEMEAEAASVEDALNQMREMQIVTQDDLDFASKLLRKVKTDAKELDEKAQRVTGPMYTALEEVRSWFRGPRKFYKECEKVLKAKIAGATEAAFERRRVTLAAAGEASLDGRKDEAKALLSKAASDELSAPPGISLRETYTYEIEDFDAIPRKYLVVDDAAVKAHIKTHKEKTDIPGIKVVMTTGVTAYTNK